LLVGRECYAAAILHRHFPGSENEHLKEVGMFKRHICVQILLLSAILSCMATDLFSQAG